MIIQPTIVTALITLGFEDGWAASEADGITIWNRSETQPSDNELIAAGWAKPTPQEETPTDEAPASDDAGAPSTDAG